MKIGLGTNSASFLFLKNISSLLLDENGTKDFQHFLLEHHGFRY